VNLGSWRPEGVGVPVRRGIPEEAFRHRWTMGRSTDVARVHLSSAQRPLPILARRNDPLHELNALAQVRVKGDSNGRGLGLYWLAIKN
jgi:hypothetical protein